MGTRQSFHEALKTVRANLQERDVVTKTYKITGSSGAIEALERVIAAFEWCNRGSSRSLNLHIDGDGNSYLKCESPDGREILSDEQQVELDKGKLSIGTD